MFIKMQVLIIRLVVSPSYRDVFANITMLGYDIVIAYAVSNCEHSRVLITNKA